MAHINHIRTIDHQSRMSLQDTLYQGYYSFGVFCGSNYRREQIALNTISNFCGNMGIVLLHNSPQFEFLLGNIYSIRPSLSGTKDFNMLLANRVNETGNIDTYYDPLYGLTETEILDVIVPVSSDARFVSEFQFLRSVITDYLSIIRQLYKSQPTTFGDYAFNLDILLELTKMPYSVLKEQILNHFPEDIVFDISSRLSADKAQQSAYRAVLTFSQSMESATLWKKHNFKEHTRLSIISAIKNKQLISLYIPETRNDVMDYLYAELQHLNKLQTPYLLVESGLNLSSNIKLKHLFLSEHNTLPYYTGIIAEDTSSIISAENSEYELASLFAQTQEMYILACSSALAAKPFSDGIGNYFRRVTERHSELHRQPFHIFGSHGHGDVQHEINQRIIDPEELVNLSNGCLLYGKNHPIPILVDNFIL